MRRSKVNLSDDSESHMSCYEGPQRAIAYIEWVHLAGIASGSQKTSTSHPK